MAIRFQCASCHQPIEIDDEHAQRLVACPYCRKTITAPSESTLPESDRIPVAAPLRTSGGVSSVMPPYYPPASKNTLAIVAFALACAVIGWLLLVVMVASQHRIELEEFAKSVEGTTSLADQWKVMMDFVERQGGNMPTWLVVMGMAQLGVMATWLAALICGIIAACRVPRRGFAVTALAICGLTLGMFCILPR